MNHNNRLDQSTHETTAPSPTSPHKSGSYLRKGLIIAIVLILLSTFSSYLFFPLLGIAIVLTAGAWSFIVATITLFCIAALIFFIVPGAFVLLLSLFAFGWVMLGIILFPFFFPIIIPIFIILLFIALMRRHR